MKPVIFIASHRKELEQLRTHKYKSKLVKKTRELGLHVSCHRLHGNVF